MKRIVIFILAICIVLQAGNVSAYAYTAEVCQGNTPDVQDVFAFKNALASKYGNGNVTIKGYSSGQITIASGTDFSNAKNYDVLYWSSHGGNWSDQPVLNITEDNSKQFYTFTKANSWQNTSKLKVAIISACYQFDGNVIRGGWVNIMQNSGLKVLAGYHAKSPTTGTDTAIANDFFQLANETTSTTQGNSVRYSWQQANIANGASAKWLVLGYKTNRLEYYRLPGFPGSFSATPSSNTVYRYSSRNINGTTATAAVNTTNPSSLPYIINVSDKSISLDLTGIDESYDTLALADDPTTVMINIRENEVEPIEEENAIAYNDEMLPKIGFIVEFENAEKENYVLLETEMDDQGNDVIENSIGVITTYMQNVNGIPLENNFFTMCSDSKGVFSIINRWKEIESVQYSDDKFVTLYEIEEKAKKICDMSEDSLSNFNYVYRKSGKDIYTLCIVVETNNNQNLYFDALSGELVEK